MAALELKPGMVMADIGTGAGYMLPYLSEAVGPSGKVNRRGHLSGFPRCCEEAKRRAEERGVRSGRRQDDQHRAGHRLMSCLCSTPITISITREVLLADFGKALEAGRTVNHCRVPQERCVDAERPRAANISGLRIDERSRRSKRQAGSCQAAKEFIPDVQWTGRISKAVARNECVRIVSETLHARRGG